MNYKNPIVSGKFIERPNRFLAKVDINGSLETVHVKNTGRCKELLVPNADVYLEYWDTDTRKTNYDLIAVQKADQLINMDSQAPNKVAAEYLPKLFPDYTLLKPEVKHRNSRFDFYLETPSEKWFIEVKGVTLEENGIARFPDAPTERGIKHVEDLIACLNEGYHAMVLFVIKMKGIKQFQPNERTHPAFGQALRKAQKAGVILHAVDCIVTPNSLTADCAVEIKI